MEIDPRRDVRGTSMLQKSLIFRSVQFTPRSFPARSILLNITAFRKVLVMTLYESRGDNIDTPTLRKLFSVSYFSFPCFTLVIKNHVAT